MMKKEIKEKWIAALRSGEYEQGRGSLRSQYNRYCCLGVLCDILNSKKWVENCNAPYGYEYSCSVHLPNDSKLRKLGLSHGVAVDLSRMNDGFFHHSPKSFSEIADWIEDNIK